MFKKWWPVLVYGVLSLLIMGPLLLPGFVLALDMTFVPHMPLPQELRASWPFYALLHTAGYLVPTDVLQKGMLIAILFFAGYGAHKLTQHFARRQLAGLVAGLLYVCNPFVYDRFVTGQFAVLMGYGLLPWFALLLLQFVRQPSVQRAVGLGALTALMGVLSVHSLGLAALLAVVAGGFALWRFAGRKRLIALSGLSVAVFLVLSSFWLAPTLLGQGATAHDLQRFTAADRAAFATQGGSVIGELANLVRLQGFWAEAQPLYLLPQDILPAWGLVALAVMALATAGGWWAWRRRQRLLVVVLALAATVATVLATSLSGALLELPFFAGFREPQKFIAVLALAYAVFAGFGALWLEAKIPPNAKVAAAGVLVLPLLFAPTLFWAANNQLTASQYPPDWELVNTTLKADDSSYNVLFLPWHQYLRLSFADRTVRTPADLFFAKPTIVSDNPEFGGLPPSGDRLARAVDQEVLPGAAFASDMAARLARHNIKYVILAKETDYQTYDYLARQADLTIAYDGQHMRLYKNTAWKEE